MENLRSSEQFEQDENWMPEQFNTQVMAQSNRPKPQKETNLASRYSMKAMLSPEEIARHLQGEEMEMDSTIPTQQNNEPTTEEELL